MALLRLCFMALIGYGMGLTGYSKNAERDIRGIISLRGLSESEVAEIKELKGISLWVEVDESLYVAGHPETLAPYVKSGRWTRRTGATGQEQLYLVSGGHQLATGKLPAEVLIRSGRKALVAGKPGLLLSGQVIHGNKFTPVTESVVLVRNLSRQRHEKSSLPLPAVASDLVAEVRGGRWMNDVEKLSLFNRYLASDDMPAAISWLENAFGSLPGFSTSRQEFSVGSRKGSNIVAEITGADPDSKIVVVGAHYDSISEDPFVSAPGAEDNASGTAALLEMARIASKIRPKHTIQFVAFSGEEQGLYGSKAYVNKLLAEGRQVKIALIMDMIAYTSDSDLDCLLETSDRNQAVIDVLSEGARAFSNLRVLSTFDYWGSDHVPFLRNNIPATLIIENDYGSYPEYHRTGDLPELLSLQMGTGILKMNMAGLAFWAYQ